MSMLIAPQLTGPLGLYGIGNAALFDGSTGYLSRTPASAGSSMTWTFRWMGQRAALGQLQYLLWANNPTTNFETIQFTANDTVQYYLYTGGTPKANYETQAVFRDPTAWLDIMVTRSGSTIEMWLNGVKQTLTENVLHTGAVSFFNSVAAHEVGRRNTSGYPYDGYLAEVVMVDGVAEADMSKFGKIDTASGNWVPKSPAVASYGVNGFYLKFANGAALGEDSSDNSHDWAVNGAITQVTATPTNVYATFNPLVRGPGVITNGNKRATGTGATGEATVTSTLAMKVKTYVEFKRSAFTAETHTFFGVCSKETGEDLNVASYLGHITNYPDAFGLQFLSTSTAIRYFANGNTAVTLASTGNTALDDTYMLAFDPDTGYIWAGYNGTWFDGGDPAAGTNPLTTMSPTSEWFPAVSFIGGLDALDLIADENDWTYPAPTGFKSLCTDNLPSVSAKNVNKHFKTVLYTGTGAARAVTGVGFQPDFVWLKNRDYASGHMVFDAARGAGNAISTDLTNAEGDYSSEFSSLDSDGFSLALNWHTSNFSGENYVAWCAALPNTKTSGWVGSPTIVPSKEIYNPTLGMSIVTYTGNGVAGATIPHSLGKKPGVVIVKSRSTVQNWPAYHASLGATKALYLNSTGAASVNPVFWNDTEPTSQLISFGTSAQTNANGVDYVVYIFAESDFIKIGSYTGNGSANGPMAQENLSPIWYLGKESSSATTALWMLFDDERETNNSKGKYLAPCENWTEGTNADSFDFVATGVKARNTNANINESGQTYVYMMIGQPTGGANTSPAPAR